MSGVTRCWISWGWQLGLVSGLAMGGAIPFSGNCAFAQVTADPSVGTVVTPNGATLEITGGTTVGDTNLFHSFSSFSVPDGGIADFLNAGAIANILARVTGGSPSDIQGLIRTQGNANLFLMNPNGIIFGENASLDVRGSFVATTANAIALANGDIFSANLVEPLPNQLLNVNPNAFFFNQIAAQPIINRSIANSTGLQVPPGQSLLLVGGAVRLEDGQMQALGGRVELGGVAGIGTVGLSVNGNDLRLSFPVGVQQADISLTNSAEVNVRASGGGSIAINAQNLNLTQGSKLEAGMASGLGLGDTQAGNIEINSTGNVSFDGEGSGAYNQVESNAIGNAGNINVTTDSLSVTNGGELNTSTWGQGNAGNVNVNARDTVSFVGESPNNSSSRVYSRVEKNALGQAGDIYIKTGSLLVSDGAFLSASTVGIGDAGNVTIDARDTVRFEGAGPPADNFFPSGAYTQVFRGATGQGGNVTITTGSLFVTNGAQLNTSTRGRGNAGNVNVNARDTVSFVGESPGNESSGAFTRVGDEGVGQGGDIYIKTGSLEVTGGAYLSAGTLNIGDAGNVTIDARDTVRFDGAGPPADDFFPSVAQTQVNRGARGRGGDIYISTGSLWVTGGALLSTRTLGIGDAGNVTINARDTVRFDGVGRSRIYPYLGSGAYSRVEVAGEGQAGDIYISAESLEVTGGAYLSAGTLGRGDAGNVTINARYKVSFDGVGRNGISSGAYGQARLSNTQGQGGNVNITADSLLVTNGAVLSSSTYSQENAGNVSINVRDKVSFDGVGRNGQPSGAYSQVEKDAGGNGGSVNITTGSLSVTNGAELIVSTFGQGNAGDLIINARNTIQLDDQSRIGSTTIVGDKGNISLRSQNLLLRRSSNITTNATGTATGGNITIDTDILVALENSDITANADVARGGQVIINAQGIIGTQFRDELTPESDITATGGSPELSGTVEINTQNVVPSAELFALPVQLADTELAQGCQGGGGQTQSEFVVTGRGGLPPNPREALNSDAVEVDLVTLNPSEENHSRQAVSTNPTSSTPAPIVEAQGWIINAKGEVVLTATAPAVTPHSSWQNSVDCRVLQSQPASS